MLDLPAYDRDAIDQAVLPVDDVHAMVERLLAMTVAERLALPWLHPGRADVIGAGALILSRVLRRTPVARPGRLRGRHPRRHRLVARLTLTRWGTDRHDHAAAADEPIGALVHRLTEQIPELVRSELRLAQAELTEKGKSAGIGVGLFSAAGLVALYGLAALLTTSSSCSTS